MMGYMEIAGHLSVVAMALSKSLLEKDDEVMKETLEAVREAELIMFRLAVDELGAQIKENR